MVLQTVLDSGLPLKKLPFFSLITQYQYVFHFHSIYGAADCPGLWSPSEEASILLCLLLVSYILFLMAAIPLCDITKAYTDIYVNTQQLLLNTTLFYTWRHVSATHTAIFRPAYNRTGPFYVRTIWDPTLFTYKVYVK